MARAVFIFTVFPARFDEPVVLFIYVYVFTRVGVYVLTRSMNNGALNLSVFLFFRFHGG